MHYLEGHDITGLLLLVDFEKAFDSIEWEFLLKAFKSFKFGPSFCKWFKTFYQDAQSSVINNGNISSFFYLKRGCRQGDPLSPYLFIIRVELLSIKLKSNPEVKGITVNNRESLISQYADDTFLVLDGTEHSLKSTMQCFNSFYKASGLKINVTKTRAIWIGNKKYSDHILCPDLSLNWSDANFKVLGLEFSLDLDNMLEINFAKKIKEVSSILRSWHHRKLTMLGKVTVIKSLAISKLVHLFTALPNLSDCKMNELNSLFYSFIWDGKAEKIKRNTLIGEYSQGGLNKVHLQSFCRYLKISWIKRYFLNVNGDWQNLLLQELKLYGEERVLYLQKEKLLEITNVLKNPFWKDVLTSLALAKPLVKDCLPSVLSLDILNFMKVEEIKLYLNWKDKGIQYVKDIFDFNAKKLFSFQQIREKIQTSNYLAYYSLLSNIPRWIKDIVKKHSVGFNLQTFVPVDDFINQVIEQKKVKFLYRQLVNQPVQLPTERLLKWEQTLGIEVTNWSKYFSILYKSCSNTYLRNFQFKLLHRVIATNSLLYKIKLVDSKLCTFCKKSEESLEHLFFSCPVTRQFWDHLTEQLRLHYVDFTLSMENITLGDTGSLFLNLMFIIAKNYVYKCKLDNKMPNVRDLTFKIKRYYFLEKILAEKKNNVTECIRFWAPLHDIFPQ